MDVFITNITSFPVVIFTFLLMVVMLYWVVVAIGLVGTDCLDMELPEGIDAGGLEASVVEANLLDAGGLEANGLEAGGLEAGGLSSGESSFAGKAVGFGGVESGVVGNAGINSVTSLETGELAASTPSSNVATGTPLFYSLLALFRLDGIPATIILSFVILFSWVISYISTLNLVIFLEAYPLRLVLGVGILFGSLVLGAFLTSLFIMPVRGKLIKIRLEEKINNNMMLKVFKVTSSQLDSKYGEIFTKDGRAGITLNARAFSDDITLEKGREVRIVRFDKEALVAYVEAV